MPYILCILLLLLLLTHNLVSYGMMVDGVFYTNIARNLADHVGSAWSVSTGPNDVFFDHPPGFFWVLSVFYKIFGDTRHVEKWFSFFCVAVQIPLIGLLASRATPQPYLQKPNWVASLLFVITPLTFLMATMNMLENLLVPLALLSAYCLIVAWQSTSRLSSLLLAATGALLLWGCVLTKGVLGLYIVAAGLGLPLLATSVPREARLRRFIEMAAVYLAVVIGLALVFYTSEEASYFWSRYLNGQVLASLAGQREMDNPHFWILWRLIQELAPMIVITLALAFKFRAKLRLSRPGLYWLFIALAATLPLLLSPKNRVWFLSLSIPFFALACAEIMKVSFPSKLRAPETQKPGRLALVTAFALLVGIGFEAYRSWNSTRYYPQFHDDFSKQKWQYEASQWVDASVCPDNLTVRWRIKADFARDYKVRLSNEKGLALYIVDTTAGCELPPGCRLDHPSKPQNYAAYRCAGLDRSQLKSSPAPHSRID